MPKFNGVPSCPSLPFSLPTFAPAPLPPPLLSSPAPPGNQSRRRDASSRRCPSGRRQGAPSPLGLLPPASPTALPRLQGAGETEAASGGPSRWAWGLADGGLCARRGAALLPGLRRTPGGSASPRAARRAGRAAAERSPLEAELLPGSGAQGARSAALFAAVTWEAGL